MQILLPSRRFSRGLTCMELEPEKVAIICPQAPAAIGPYAQAVKFGNMIFVSGQIPIHPQTGEVFGENTGQQTELVIRYLKVIMEQAGGALANIVKTTVYLANMDDFAQMNGVYEKHFDYNPPARATVEVSRLPKGVLVEIDAIAILRDLSAKKQGVSL